MTGIWETGSGKTALSYRPCTRYESSLLMFVWFLDPFCAIGFIYLLVVVVVVVVVWDRVLGGLGLNSCS